MYMEFKNDLVVEKFYKCQFYAEYNVLPVNREVISYSFMVAHYYFFNPHFVMQTVKLPMTLTRVKSLTTLGS